MFDYREYLDDERKEKILERVIKEQELWFEKYLIYHKDEKIELMEKRIEMMQAFFKQNMNDDPEKFLHPEGEKEED